MSAKILTLCTSKGGTGKSTLVCSLAAHWFRAGRRVAIVDADPQASVAGRHRPEGADKGLCILSDPGETVDDSVRGLQNTFDLVLIDTGGFRNRTTIKALLCSHGALVPLKPSVDDVVAAVDMLQTIQKINQTPEKLRSPIWSSLILTMTQRGTVIAKQVRRELEQRGLPLLRSEMILRVAYPEAAINGLSPCLTEPKGAAARDIVQIVGELEKNFFPKE